MARGEPLSTPPRTTAIGALAYYVSHADPAHYDPSNITFGIMPPLDNVRGKQARKLALADRALQELDAWQPHSRVEPAMTTHLKAFLQYMR
jgi:methylenetetrahydrofolate--tRNA-(uracil-5-)-methyltransferase